MAAFSPSGLRLTGDARRQATSNPSSVRAMVEHGLWLAGGEDAGNPALLRDAVLALVAEAADTLARLPCDELALLCSQPQSAWPETLRDPDKMDYARPMRYRASRPSPGAITRLPEVLWWLEQAKTRNPRRDIAIAMALCGGVRPQALRREFGLCRDSLYKARDRVIAHVVLWLRPQLHGSGLASQKRV